MAFQPEMMGAHIMTRSGITALSEKDTDTWTFAEMINLYGVLSRASGTCHVYSTRPDRESDLYHGMAMEFMLEAIALQQAMFARMNEFGRRPDILMNMATMQPMRA